MTIAAYFDVDDTLTTRSTLESFIRFYARSKPPGNRVEASIQPLLSFAADNNDLDAIHQRYAAAFTSEPWADLVTAGESWFSSLDQERFFRSPVVQRLQAHKAAGLRTVVLSGSWAPCLEPIAAYLGIDDVLCSTVAITDGRCTGRFERMMLAHRKAEALVEHAETGGINLAESYGYGDHISDEDYLALLGHPVVVGAGALAARGRERGWEILAPSLAQRV